jgi:hypothetical protein
LGYIGYAIFEADRDTTTVGDNYHIKFENPIRLVEAVGEFRKSVPVNNPWNWAFVRQRRGDKLAMHSSLHESD